MNASTKTDLVFHALANRTRRSMIDLVKQMPGCSVNDICQHFDMSRIGVMKHLGVLVDANLVVSRKKGRTRELFFNAVPIQMIYDRWTDEYAAFWATQAVDLKHKVEKKIKQSKKTAASNQNPYAASRKKKSTANRNEKVGL